MINSASIKVDRHILRTDLDKKQSWRTLPFWRKGGRTLFRILLAVGFVAQSAKLIGLYLLYPAGVELEVVQPSEVDMPAFTVCNINE